MQILDILGFVKCQCLYFGSWAEMMIHQLNPSLLSFFLSFSLFFFFYFNWRLIIWQYCGGFCYTSTWISHGCTCVPHPHPSSPSHLWGSSQCTSPEHPASCIKSGLLIYFTYVNIHVSMLFSQIIPPSPSPTVSNSLFFTSGSLLLSRI